MLSHGGNAGSALRFGTLFNVADEAQLRQCQPSWIRPSQLPIYLV